MNIYRVLRRPIVTEKSSLLKEQGNKYVFEVAREANKYQIKQAVEKIFKVAVAEVNVSTIAGETRRVGRHRLVTSPQKKAIVTLKKGSKIDIIEGV